MPSLRNHLCDGEDVVQVAAFLQLELIVFNKTSSVWRVGI
jgi:hypothetical protein